MYRNNKTNRNKFETERRDNRHMRDKRLGKDTTRDWKKEPARITDDMLMRSQYNNLKVEELKFWSTTGKQYKIKGDQLNLFTLMPSKPLIICNSLKIEVTYDKDVKEVNNQYLTRICYLNGKPENCLISADKLDKGECQGSKSQVASLEFWVVCNGTIGDGISGDENFKVAFINKKELEKRDDNPPKFSKEGVSEFKLNSLNVLLKTLRLGRITLKKGDPPKPGNLIFHTLFSGTVDVVIGTIKGEILKGTVKGYEFTPGGIPCLNLWNGDTLRWVSLNSIEFMVTNKYELPDVLRRKALKLLLKGHIVIPHRDNHTIYDYCRFTNVNGTLKEQEILLDNRIIPRDLSHPHDIEVFDIIKEE